MKILVLGGAGMLGHKVFQVLGERFADTRCTVRVRPTDRAGRSLALFAGEKVITDVDASDSESLRHLVRSLSPEFIVNCVGVIKQRDSAKIAIPSIEINALLPHKLAAWAEGWGGRVIHFSTDCVFSGKRGSYTEDDPSDAEDLYGKTKYLGEVAASNALTLRTSIVGRELSQFASLLEWFLAQAGGQIHGFKRVIYSGLTTNFLARTVADIIEQHASLQGLYQVASAPIPKYDLLCLIRDAYGLNVDIRPDNEVISDRSLVGTRFERATGIEVPTWKELVAELAADPTPYESWR